MNDILRKLRGAVSRRQAQGGGVKTTFGGQIATFKNVDVRASTMNWGSYKWVLAITFLVAVYYGFIASDRYVTETQLYVKSAKGSALVLPSMALLSGVSGQSQDSLVLQSYISSSDMLLTLEQKIGVKEHFSSSDWDWFSRLSKNADFEDFLSYFRDSVKVAVDPGSSVLTVFVSAYSPEYSRRLADEILVEAEAYLNSIGQKIALEEISFMENQLASNRKRLDAAKLKLLQFQNRYETFSPKADGRAMQSIVSELEAELVRLQTEKKVLASYLNDTAPQLVSLNSRIDSVEAQLKEERGKIGPGESQSINELYVRFEELEQELKFAADLYAATLASLEQAKVESYHKLKHLVILQSPKLPDEALEPRKLYNLATLFVLLSLAYGIVTMILATIREHRDV